MNSTPSPVTDWTPICRVDDIAPLGARRVARAQGKQVAVFRAADDHIFALLDHCPHRGGPLSQGIVFGNSVACPMHGWTIELASGEARAPDHGCTTPFAVKVVGGVVHLSAHELATRAVGEVAHG